MKLLGVVRRRRPALLVSTALCATVTMVVSLPAAAQPAPNAQPTGGVVVGGSASISQSANQTTINQASQRGAINWQTFNVGSQAQVQFNQPNVQRGDAEPGGGARTRRRSPAGSTPTARSSSRTSRG